MKNIICSFLLAIILSSCALSTATTFYSMSRGKIDIPQKETYSVVYQANFGDGLMADMAYTTESGKQTELKEINGAWERTVTLKSGTHVRLTTFATAKHKSKGEYKILVDGKVVSEYVLSGRKLEYTFAFDLP
ncbi:hypothetical protein [Pedobacter alluvionis]|uniref:Lipoprotein n=1 Tax=Pedobacter alluvionis TaxID=475253 RepID=A0A497Y2U2_9SPHI|nr:hypothetical protein [Pedobacter alluvionis]RLJ77092.1 hypothetical protein BCL90_2156 [Pedobacter alluvionis]TFB33665.1 hypothetical protein E3V97_06380 [Pedobacter alluvionis]